MINNILFKTITLFILISIVSCDKGESKIDKNLDWIEYADYIPLPENDAIWINEFSSENIYGSDEFPSYSIITTNQYFFKGDTLINDIYYRKLYNNRIAKKLTFETNNEVVVLDTTDIYSGAMRQDISQKKVFFIFDSDIEEKLLYDFDIELGDTISLFTTSERIGTVSCVDSIHFYGRFHNYYHINVGGLSNAICIVEGIGNTDGLIMEMEIYTGGSFQFNLVSFEYKEEKINVTWDIFPYKCN